MKFLLHHGELSKLIPGDASLMFTERNKEIFYVEDVKEAIKKKVDEVIERNKIESPELALWELQKELGL